MTNQALAAQLAGKRKDKPMEGKKEHRKLTLTSTKQEMLQAYNTLLKELDARQEGELKPEKKIEEKKTGRRFKWPNP